MGFYDDEANVEEYLRSADGYDGRRTVDRLREFLPPGATVLELGMGPGKDYAFLRDSYRVTASDTSEAELRSIIEPSFSVVVMERYGEMEDGDSILAIARAV